MSVYRYVLLDPTGNVTALVLDPVPPEEEAAVTRKLLTRSEQAAYLEKPSRSGAAAAIRLMGGEFCGNAAMAAAAWLVRESLRPGEETVVPLQVSGAAETLACRIRAAEGEYEGTVAMPRILAVRDTVLRGTPLTEVRMEGITHLMTDRILDREAAEELLRSIAGELTDEALGLLQWRRETGEMRPLVWVRGSGSLVWENGCGSGSAAVGAAEALRAGNGETVTDVRQPGGTIRVRAAAEGGTIRKLTITGRVRLGKEETVEVP